jgi:hypothetical protein
LLIYVFSFDPHFFYLFFLLLKLFSIQFNPPIKNFCLLFDNFFLFSPLFF